jgi:hypothetical protein
MTLATTLEQVPVVDIHHLIHPRGALRIGGVSAGFGSTRSR